MFDRIKQKPWAGTGMAICMGVVLYVLLAHFAGLWEALREFVGFFKPLILACVFAFIINPLVKLFESIFSGIKREKVRRLLAIVVSYIIVLLFLVFAFAILIPQFINSIQTLSENLPGYVASANALLENWGISKTTFDLSKFIDTSESAIGNIVNFVGKNINNIIESSANIGKGILRWIIAFIISIYLLVEKPVLRNGTKRLIRASFGDERYDGVMKFLRECNRICNRYVVFNMVDSMIIGVANAIIMAIFGMPYVGLISFVVAITNLVPTFGPFVGAIIGALILLMEKPLYALILVIMTLVLQALDAYLIKPRLFGSSLGVSGLWIIIGIIVGGNMFGVVGILLAIPCVAILDFLYGDYLVPSLERKRGITPAPAEGPPAADEPKKE